MTEQEKSEKLKLEARRSIHNSVGDAKRSLLDYVDFMQQTKGTPETKVFVEFFKRRIHNDLPRITQQLLAIFEIYDANGVMPPFGGSPEQRRTILEGNRQAGRPGGNGWPQRS